MKKLISLLILSCLLSGCAIFAVPDKTVEAPAVPKTTADKSQAWAADQVKQKREAERTQFDKDLKQAVSEDSK